MIRYALLGIPLLGGLILFFLFLPQVPKPPARSESVRPVTKPGVPEMRPASDDLLRLQARIRELEGEVQRWRNAYHQLAQARGKAVESPATSVAAGEETAISEVEESPDPEVTPEITPEMEQQWRSFSQVRTADMRQSFDLSLEQARELEAVFLSYYRARQELQIIGERPSSVEWLYAQTRDKVVAMLTREQAASYLAMLRETHRGF